MLCVSYKESAHGFKVEKDNFFALTYEVNVDCTVNSYRIMKPSVFRLVPCKPCFQYAILSATG